MGGGGVGGFHAARFARSSGSGSRGRSNESWKLLAALVLVAVQCGFVQMWRPQRHSSA
jgi:hypothetical protein